MKWFLLVIGIGIFFFVLFWGLNQTKKVLKEEQDEFYNASYFDEEE